MPSHLSPQAIATPMAAPTTGDDASSASVSGAMNESPGSLAICVRISPMIKEENSPSAMAPMASMK